MQSSFLDEPLDPTGANQVVCADLSLLFTLFITRLLEVIARTGGKPLADQFVQQLNFLRAAARLECFDRLDRT